MDDSWQDAVVLIESGSNGNSGYGTGFVVHRDERGTYVLTCTHVVDDVGGKDLVTINDIPAMVIASSPSDSIDITVLCIAGLVDKPLLRLYANCKREGTFECTGYYHLDDNPKKKLVLRQLHGILTDSIKAGKTVNTLVTFWEMEITSNDGLRPGNSGSPVVDENTRVIGLVNTRLNPNQKRGWVTPIEALAKVWLDIPSDLLAQEKGGSSEDETSRLHFGSRVHSFLGKILSFFLHFHQIKETDGVKLVTSEQDLEHASSSEAPRWFYRRGNNAFLHGRYKEACEAYTQCIFHDPSHTEAYYYRGRSYASLNQHSEAIQDYDKAIGFDSHEARFHYRKGLSLAALKHYVQAVYSYTSALAQDSRLSSAYYERGLAHTYLKQYKQALRDYNQAIHFNSSCPLFYAHKGCVLLECAVKGIKIDGVEGIDTVKNYTTDLYEEALVCFKRDDSLPLSHIGQEITLMALGRYKEALGFFEQAPHLTPPHLFSYVYKGVILLLLDRNKEANETFDRAIYLVFNSALNERDEEDTFIQLLRQLFMQLLNRLIHFNDAFASSTGSNFLLPKDATPPISDTSDAFAQDSDATKLRIDDERGRDRSGIQKRPLLALAYLSKAYACQNLGRFNEADAALKRAIHFDGSLAMRGYKIGQMIWSPQPNPNPSNNPDENKIVPIIAPPQEKRPQRPRKAKVPPKNWLSVSIAAVLVISLLFASILLFAWGLSTFIQKSPSYGPVDPNAKTITLGILSPYSGPIAAPIGIPLANGVKAFFDHVNDNGGIDGFKVKFLEEDTKYDPQTEVSLYNQIHNNVLMIADSLGTPTTFAIKNLATEDHMLVSAATLSSALAREKYLILVGTPYRLQVENAFDYMVNKLGMKNPATGIIYQNDEYGQDGLTGYKEAVAAYNLKDVGQAAYRVTDTDFTAEVSKMKAAGAKYVFLTTLPLATAGIIGTAAKLGYFPQWILQSPAFNLALLQVPHLVPLLSKAWMVAQGAAWGDTSVPGMAQLLQDVAKYYPNQKPDGYFEFGYAESYITYAILKNALDNKDLSRANLFKTFESLNHVDLGDLYPPATYGPSPNQRVPTRGSVIYAIDPTAPAGVKPLTPDFTGAAAKQSQF